MSGLKKKIEELKDEGFRFVFGAFDGDNVTIWINNVDSDELIDFVQGLDTIYTEEATIADIKDILDED